MDKKKLNISEEEYSNFVINSSYIIVEWLSCIFIMKIKSIHHVKKAFPIQKINTKIQRLFLREKIDILNLLNMIIWYYIKSLQWKATFVWLWFAFFLPQQNNKSIKDYNFKRRTKCNYKRVHLSENISST